MNSTTTPLRSRAALTVVAMVLLVAACGSYEPSTVGQGADTNGAATSTSTTTSASAVGLSSFTAEVWADNWFALYVVGELVGEDSVPITTERSFNSETIAFEATYPFTIGIEAKDFKETDSGLEYIGTDRQQMGDGGMIAQITDNATGQVVAVTDASWSALVVQRAPLNTECEKAADPDTACEHETIEIPADWAAPGFDDSGWAAATEWSAADVGPKDGYDEISWDPAAKLVWGSDLKIDNTMLLRATVSG
jgi:hypothetical protein